MPVVLVHGGGYDARCWDLLTPLLDAPVLAVDLPGRGAHPDRNVRTVTLVHNAESVVADIERAGLSDVTLVAHSVAGVTVPRVMQSIPDRLAHVVFVSAVVPPDGTRVLDQIDPAVRTAVEESIAGGIYDPGPDALRAMLCADMDDEQSEFTLSRAVPDSAATLSEHVDLAGLAVAVPRTYIRLNRDLCYPPELQARSAELVAGGVVHIDSGHMVMIEYPQLLADVVNNIARR